MSDGLDDAAQTAAEHVAVSAADPSAPGAKARPSRKAALRPDAKSGHCANCGTALQGPVCHHCGQLDDEFHRPVRGLIGEIVEGLFALDGRVARTIPNLLLRPGRITRAYLKGQRARFMPPFRLYIIASLVFFLLAPFATGWLDIGDAEVIPDAIENAGEADQIINEAIESGELTPEEVAETRAALDQFGLGGLMDDIEARVDAQSAQADLDAATGADPPVEPVLAADEALAEDNASPDDNPAGDVQPGSESVAGEDQDFSIGGDGAEETAESIRRFFTPEDFGEPAPEGAWPYAVRSYLGERFARVVEDPSAWLEEAADWVPRIMFAMVPVYALLLSLTYAWRRGFFLYDHLIVSVHFHAALFLAMTVFYLASYVLSGALMVLAFFLYSNIYLYKLQRVVYERGRVSSVLRTLALDFVYAVILAFGWIATLLLGALAV